MASLFTYNQVLLRNCLSQMKVLGTILIIIFTSLFYFPFNTSLLPAVNTKMLLAAGGLIIFIVRAAQKHNAEADNRFVKVSLWALLVSAVGTFSALFNGTEDYTYASYIVSAWVWLGGAYAVVKCCDVVYGKTTLRVITNILITVCVLQCFMSQIINTNVSIAEWVDSFMVSTGFMGKAEGRLYGIGCALDVAGLKFCVVLILLSYFAVNPSGRINVYIETSLYVVSFLVIAILGAMISRTTSIGVLMAVAYWIFVFISGSRHTYFVGQTKYLWTVMGITLALFLPIIVYYYQVNDNFHENIRFGFEGFFSLIEKGEWDVGSNNRLMGMWVWPDNLKTWLIGDGYFNSPNSNPYYIGPYFKDFYMGTDIGYCRFVFYFGVIGLVAFSIFFINCAKQCSNIIPQCRIMFILILLINFIGWVKVSSDIFPIYALILMLENKTETDLSV